MISSKKHSYKMSPKDIVPGMQLQVKSMDWYTDNKDRYGIVRYNYVGTIDFLESMSEFCGKSLTVKRLDPLTALILVEETEHVFCLDHFENTIQV